MRLSDLVTNGSQDGRITLAKEDMGLSPSPVDRLALIQGDSSGQAVSNSDLRQIKLNYL